MNSSPLRVIYAGTPDFAVPALQSLLASEHDVLAVYTQPDRPAGRGKKIQMSPVKQAALSANVDVLQPLNFKAEADMLALEAYQADLMVVAAYGLILPQRILDAPTFGCWNIHASLLPRWRGAAPIQRAILAGDDVTGVTLMQMAAGLDTGDMLLKAETPINEFDTAQNVHDNLADIGADLLMRGIAQLQQNDIVAEKQNDALANYAHKISKQDARIDWSLSAVEIDRHIRAYYGWPVAFTALHDKPNDNIRLWSALVDKGQAQAGEIGEILTCDKQGILVQTGEGQINIQSLQMAGAKRLDAKAFVNANNLSGLRFV